MIWQYVIVGIALIAFTAGMIRGYLNWKRGDPFPFG